MKALQAASSDNDRTLIVPWTRSIFPDGRHVVFTAWDRTQRCTKVSAAALTAFAGAYRDADASGQGWGSPSAPTPSGAPSPTPTPTATATASASAKPSASSSAAATPTPSPAATPIPSASVTVPTGTLPKETASPAR